MIDEIKQHFDNEYPKEACGILGIVKGKKRWFPCRNVAEHKEDFVMSSEDWFDIKKRADIFAIVHNHINSSNEPSENDINNCNALGIPYYIFSYPDLNLNIVEPKENFNPLIGRDYKFGVNDCFEAMRDWLNKEGINIPKRAAFEDDWWHKNLDYFTDEIIKNYGYSPVDGNMKPNDVIIFKINASVGNHCGVYLGDDIFYHHAENRISCRENLYPFWKQHISGVYRHET